MIPLLFLLSANNGTLLLCEINHFFGATFLNIFAKLALFLFSNGYDSKPPSSTSFLQKQSYISRTIDLSVLDVDLHIQRGHLEVVKWLIKNGAQLQDDCLYSAATTGNIELCKWLKKNGCAVRPYSYCPSTLPLLQLLVEWGFVPDPEFFFNAASNGYFDQIKWAKSRGYEWDSNTCACAAAEGRLDILQWVRERGCPWDEVCCENAARCGHMEILQYARGRNCPWNMVTIIAAAEEGHFEIIKWAVDNGCPLPNIIDFNIKSISIFEYLINKGCVIDIGAIRAAASEGNMEVLKWLLFKSSPNYEYDRKHICNMAAKYGDLNMLQWTKENKYEWSGYTLSYAVRHPHVFKWLRNNGCKWDWVTLEHSFM